MTLLGVWQGWDEEVWRHLLERPDRHTLSLVALGLRWPDRARFHRVPLSPHLAFP